MVIAATIAVHVFALQLVLYTLAIRSVPNQRKNGPNAFYEKSPLTGLRIIQGSLWGRLSFEGYKDAYYV